MERDDPNDRLVFIRPAALPGTELMAGYDCTQPFHYFHQRYAFVACASVASGVRYRGRDDHLVDRCVMVLEPGEIHYNTYVAKPANFKVLFIDPQAFDDCARQLGRPEGFHFPPAPITSDPRLFPALQRLCASIEDGHEALEQQSLFAACVMAFGRHVEHQPRALEVSNGRFAVERAKAHLQDRFNEAVSLHELAAVSQLSQFHLVHAFSKRVGLPPHAFHVHVRVERARALLQEGMSPANAAASVGFADQSHFTRHFKRIMRVTPAEYARPWRSHSHPMPEVGVVRSNQATRESTAPRRRS